MQKTIRSPSIVMVTTMIAASVFCGVAAPTRAATPTASDACSLLSKQDAAAALGGAVTGPESKSGLPMGPGTTVSSCEYSGSGYHKVHLDLMRLSPDTVAMYRAMCAKQGKEGLAGLGDLACWYNGKHEELHALKGNAFVSIELRGSDNPTDAIKGVMKKALERL